MLERRGFFGRFRVDAFAETYGVVTVDDGPQGWAGPLVYGELLPDGSMRRRYVGERPLRWYEPVFARIVLSSLFVDPGQVLPPWYYALGYCVEPWMGQRHGAVFFFLPVAILVRALRWVEFLWNRARARPSWFDHQLHKARGGRREPKAGAT